MSEIKDKARKELIELIYPLVSGTYGGVDWGKLMGITESTVDKILSKEYIAIVDRGAELPAFVPPSHIVGTAVETIAYQWHCKTQQDMLKAGWVKEMK